MRTEVIADGVECWHANYHDVLPLLSSVDAVVCDLPYGTTDCAWDVRQELGPLWAAYKRLLPEHGAAILNASQPFTSILVMSNPAWFKVEWIWRKNAGSNFGTVKWQPMKEHESVLVFAPGVPTYRPIMEDRAPAGLSRSKYVQNYDTDAEVYGSGALNRRVTSKATPDGRVAEKRYPSSVQRFNRERGLHPTQKPVKMNAYFIETYTEPGATILDHCMGSGSTGVAAIETGRAFIGVESDAEHFDTACRRLAETMRAKLALPLSMGL